MTATPALLATTKPTTSVTTTVALKPVGHIAGIVLGPAEPKDKDDKEEASLVDVIQHVETGGVAPPGVSGVVSKPKDVPVGDESDGYA